MIHSVANADGTTEVAVVIPDGTTAVQAETGSGSAAKLQVSDNLATGVAAGNT